MTTTSLILIRTYGWHRHLLLATTLALSAGCVFPLKHTYFEPNPSDGTPEASHSCGFLTNDEDMLTRDVKGVRVMVYPYFHHKANNAEVHISLRYPTPSVTLNPKHVNFFDSRNHNHEITYSDVTKKVQMPDRTHHYWVIHTFRLKEKPSLIEGLTVILDDGAATVNGVHLEKMRFRFQRKTSTDLYYFTINC